jgi:hypothetical protein
MLGRAYTDNLSLTEVGELQLGGKSVEAITRGVTEAELVGVFVELMELGNARDNIEISGLSLGLVEVDLLFGWDTVVASEVG